MKITNARKDDTGGWQFDMDLSAEEISFLVELSVTSLIKVGVLTVEEKATEQEFNLEGLQTQGVMQ